MTDRRSRARLQTPKHFSVALSFEDGVTRFITCRDDQTVADASYRQRINIPLDCRDGACGTCKALCESGNYDGGTYIDDALPPDEAAAGYVLPCSMRPRSDLVLQIASTSDVAKTQAATYSGTLTHLDRLSATTVALGVEIPNRAELAFLPGQYVNIAVPGTDQTRSYSFSNSPQDDLLTFLVKLTPGGAMSEYLTQRASVGDSISFTGPNGSFFLRENDRPVLLLAGGTGLAPVLSMLRTLRDGSSRRKAHLIYGVSTDEDLVALDEIEEIAATLSGFSWDFCVSDPQSTAQHKGYVASLIKPAHLYDGDVAVYLCGPPPMVESVRTHVTKAGIEPTGFYYEKFALAHVGTAPEPASAPPSVTSPEQALLVSEDARGIAGHVVLPRVDIAAHSNAASGIDDGQAIRSIAGQLMAPATGTGDPTVLGPDDGALIQSDARHLAGQTIFGRYRPAECRSPGTDSRRGPGRVSDRRGASRGTRVRRPVRGAAGAGTRRTGADVGTSHLTTAGGVPAAGRVHHALRGRRPLRGRGPVHRDQRRLPRLPVHPDRQRPSASGVSSSRRQRPHERSASQREVVPPAVRAGPHGHRQRLRGRRPRRGPRPDHRPRGTLQADHAPRDVRRGHRTQTEVRHARPVHRQGRGDHRSGPGHR